MGGFLVASGWLTQFSLVIFICQSLACTDLYSSTSGLLTQILLVVFFCQWVACLWPVVGFVQICLCAFCFSLASASPLGSAWLGASQIQGSCVCCGGGSNLDSQE